MTVDEMITITHPEETDPEREGVQEIEATEETEAEIINPDETTPVSEIEDVEMSLRSQRSASEMTADLGHLERTPSAPQER